MAFTKEAVEFLMENKFHDSKEWFRQHREQYDQLVLNPMRALVAEIAPAMLELDDRLIAEPKVGRSISRIYRDTRFSKDKSTFRDVVWCVFLREKKLYEGPPAFYFEFSPSKLRWGCGYYRASPRDMDTMRGLIVRQDPDFDAARRAVGKDGYFELEGERYKRSKFPDIKGPARQWLDQKNISVNHNGGAEGFDLLYSPELGGRLVRDFRRLKPLYEFFLKTQRLSFEQAQERQAPEQTPLPRAPKQQFDW